VTFLWGKEPGDKKIGEFGKIARKWGKTPQPPFLLPFIAIFSAPIIFLISIG
jgi:hypothetical protein